MARGEPEFVVPQVKSGDGILLQASGGHELVFSKVELVADARLMTVKFIVGNNSISVMVSKGTARDLLNMLADQFDLKLEAR